LSTISLLLTFSLQQPVYGILTLAMTGLVLWLERMTRGEHQRMATTVRQQQLFSELSRSCLYSYTLPDGRRSFDQAIEGLLGYPLQQWRDQPDFWSELLHPDEQAEVQATIATHLAEQRAYQLEYRLRASDNRWVWIADRSYVTSEPDGERVGYGVVIDISGYKQSISRLEAVIQQQSSDDQQRMDELRLANAELARASRIKDDFLSGMSHELRTPLNAILILSESLEEGVYGALSQNQLVTLQTISESGHHLLALINDILDLSKIEAGRFELNFSMVDLHALCQASIRMVKQQALLKRLKLELNLDFGVSQIRADERRLKQILVNLLSNAVKFTPDGGSIQLTIRGDVAARQLTISVSDTGIGIPPEKQALLFQPFTQLDSSLARKYDGTGLGLALVRRLTELHGGQVSLLSEPEHGSCFTVTLPWDGEEQQTGSSSSVEQLLYAYQEPTAPSPPRVLLVADASPHNSASYTHLHSLGMPVTLVSYRPALGELAQELQPGLIVMELHDPIDEDLPTIRRLRSYPDLLRTPILAIAATNRADNRERCLAAGSSAYINCPLSLEDLQQLLPALLSQADNDRRGSSHER
jgi:signal transduction histidine kinase/CheY-like chemotaxis protein